MINRFKQNAPQAGVSIPDDEDDYGWLLLARHHGLRSRLLDWTESLLVGLYFAVEARDGPEQTGAVWCLLPLELNRGLIGETLPMFSQGETLFAPYLPGQAKVVPPELSGPPLACIAPRISSRLQAQQAVFTVHHADPTALETLAPEHIWRYVIPAEDKPEIREHVRLLGVTRRTLFPDLDNIADDAKEGV